MPLLHRFSQILLLFTCISSLSAIAAPATTDVTVKFRIARDCMIVVPVTINGSGPYDFVVDTGSNNTMLDQKLADELALPRGGDRTGLEVMGSTTLSAVSADSLSIASATVAGKDLFLFASSNLHGLPPKVRGLLGEDFLQNFDVLIDYRHQIIQLESGVGTLAETLTGEHLPVQLSGTWQGRPTLRRLIVTGHIEELGNNAMSLLLDSGTINLSLFRESLGPGSNRLQFVEAGIKSSGLTTMETRNARRLSLGRGGVDDVTVIAVARQSDTDGLLPTSFFHAIFISHQGRFVILNPSVPRVNH
jgi:predicted aspartyl protease